MTELNPCPFCGAGETHIHENGKVWLGMRYSEPSSVSILHHCAPVAGQPSRAIERVGRDETSAVEAWNRRTQPAQQAQAEVVPDVAGISGDKLSEFRIDQWWFAELEAAVKDGTTDQKRAVFVVRNLLGTVQRALHPLLGAKQAEAVPQGWKLVPVEPTEKMISEGSCAQSLPGPHYITESAARRCWQLMLAAAPQPKEQSK